MPLENSPISEIPENECFRSELFEGIDFSEVLSEIQRINAEVPKIVTHIDYKRITQDVKEDIFGILLGSGLAYGSFNSMDIKMSFIPTVIGMYFALVSWKNLYKNSAIKKTSPEIHRHYDDLLIQWALPLIKSLVDTVITNSQKYNSQDILVLNALQDLRNFFVYHWWQYHFSLAEKQYPYLSQRLYM